ncbi:pyridoxamine 5'-phosphate oxidase family protein [Nonomuraea sp. B5E05]|uniref:pyridoxamine 5'-phosphate oxidase family protein n=1 Tax=Nonomuraea sp. B5E05 TaxID=3153569 RepID=UPI0032614ABA
MRRTQKFQLCTVRRDGRPHVTPLLAIWALGAMWFTTGDNEQKAKNLSANPHCALTTGTGTLTGTDYVIEGTASLVTDQVTRQAVAAVFEQAYGWQLTREDGTWYQLGEAIRTGNVQLYRTRRSPSPPVASRPKPATSGAESTASGGQDGGRRRRDGDTARTGRGHGRSTVGGVGRRASSRSALVRLGGAPQPA